MGKRILVEHGYTVPDRYIELEECEELCESCHGTGKTRQYYGPPGGWDGRMTCFECGGAGKRLRCTACGELQRHPVLKHEGSPWADTLCLECIKKDERFKISV